MEKDVIEITDVIYVLISIGMAIYFGRKVKQKYFAFIVFLWVFAQPIINNKFSVKIPMLNVDLNLNRILLISCIFVVLFGRAERIKNYVRYPAFEIFFFFYMFIVVLSLFFNSGEIGVKRFLATSLEIVTFAFIYYTLKNHMRVDFFKVLISGILLLAIFNSILSLYQLLIDYQFLRVGDARKAFGSFYRSSGVFNSEYSLGIFQIISLYILVAVYRGKKVLFVLSPLIVMSVFSTFHRLDFVILIVTFIFYLTYYSVVKFKIFIVLGVLMFIGAGMPLYELYKSVASDSEFIKERLEQDTVSGRFKQYKVVINEIPKYPLGLGSHEHRIYQQLMIRNKMTISLHNPKTGEVEEKGLVVHNGFLSIGMRHGLIALFLFAMFLITALMYFKKRINKDIPVSIVPVFAIIVWALSNISNAIIEFRSYEIIFIAILLGSYAGLYNQGYMIEKNG